MEKKILGLLLFIVVFLFFLNLAESGRMPPKGVKPVIYKKVQFTAPHERMGYIKASDLEQSSMPVYFKVYEVKFNPNLEQVAQYVFITSLDIKGDKLIVINERNERYEIDLTKIVMDNCTEACVKNEFLSGVCLGGGSAVDIGSGCDKAGGTQLQNCRDMIIKGCNFEAIGSWDECCCFVARK